MQSFEFTLKNEKLKSYNKITLFLQLIYLSLVTFYIFKSPQSTPIIFPLIVIIIIAGNLIMDHFLKSTFRNRPLIQLVSDIVAAIAFIIIFKNYWFAFLIIAIIILRSLASKKFKIIFSAEEIKLDFLSKRNIKWQQLNNAILKDGLLTVDFKDDHLIQAEITEESLAVDEQAFNQFCSNQLQTANLKL